MDAFPAIDPIPLPAPVWLFKLLHTVTLALHFTAVHFLIGGLFMALVWGVVGRMRRDDTMLNASGAVTMRLPIVMAYVVNLGIPPLLFAQVLYGPALYTSSVLMGVWWISVIFLIIGAYFLLYRMVKRAEGHRAFNWMALISLIVFLKVGFIFSKNMTLMLRPDLWVEMYRSNPTGFHFHRGDPTTLPRWLFMMLGSIGMVGIGLMLLSIRGTLDEKVRAFLRRWGGSLLAIFTVVQIGLAFMVFKAQPEAVRAGVMAIAVYKFAGLGWLVMAVLLIVLGGLTALRPERLSMMLTALSALIGLAGLIALVLFRDGIRDVTLKRAGFDVWGQAVYSNWPIICLFLLLFVGGAGMIGWMAYVMLRAKGKDEQYV